MKKNNTVFDFDTTRSPYSYITGKTQMIHSKRLEMGLSCDEYVLADAIERASAKGKFTPEIINKMTGFTSIEIGLLITSLTSKGILIKVKKKQPQVTRAWKENFEVNQEEFIKFWAPIEIHGEKYKWTGSKFDAEKKWKLARKEYSFEFLMQQKKYYFHLLVENTWRKVIGASVFLNMDKKRFTEDFKTQLKSLNFSEDQQEKISKEDYDKLYDK